MPRAARGQRLAPAGARRGFEHRLVARMLAEERAAQLERILLRLARDLVEEAFGGERGMRRADRAPPLHRHAHLRRVQRHREVRDLVGQVRSAFDRGGVHAVLDHHALERGAGEDRLPDDDVLPGDEVALGVEAACSVW